MEKDPRVKYVKNMDRQGVGRARNIGISKSEGKYIAILDSDDFWCDKQKLQMQVSFMDQHPEYALISVDALVVDGNGKEIGEICNHCTDKKLRANILFQNKIVHSGILFRSDMFEQVGRYDESLTVGEDYDLWLKLGKLGKFENIDHKMVAYRKHNSGQESTARIHRSLKHNIEVINRHKDAYPNFFIANIRRQLRYLLAKLLFKEKK
jgi:glycosyltransferase involved in cell wall biosynthesis